jgi:hypothetical protein
MGKILRRKFMLKNMLKMVLMTALFAVPVAQAEIQFEPGLSYAASGSASGKIYIEGGSEIGSFDGDVAGLLASLKVMFNSGNWGFGLEYMKDLSMEYTEDGDTVDFKFQSLGIAVNWQFMDKVNGWLGLGMTGETQYGQTSGSDTTDYSNNMVMKVGVGYKALDWLRVNAEFMQWSAEIDESGLGGSQDHTLMNLGVSFPI